MSKSLFYVTLGKKENPWVVFLHGFLGNHQDWQPIYDQLSHNYYCLVFDLPGHGHSGEVYTESLTGFLSQMKEALKEKPIFALVGYSMGGRLALSLLLESSLAMKKLVLESASAGLTSIEEKKQRLESEERWHKLLTIENMHLFLEKWYEQPVFANLTSEQKKEYIRLRKKNNPLFLSQALKAFSLGVQKSYWDKLSKIKNPVLLLTGSQDQKFYKINQAMVGELPLGQHQVVSGGHNIHQENPQEYLRCLQRFLGE